MSSSVPTELLRQYDQEGFVFLEAALNSSILRDFQIWLEEVMLSPGENAVITDGGELQAIYGVHLDEPYLLDILRVSLVKSALRHLLGGSFYLYQSQLHLKPASSPPLDWHQDFRAYNHFDGLPSSDGVIVGTFLDTVSIDTAPVAVIPQSHREGLLPSEQTACVPLAGPSLDVSRGQRSNRKHRIQPNVIKSITAKYGTATLIGDAGSIFLCHPCLVHSSSANPSGRRRAILYTNVFHTEIRPQMLSRPPSVVAYEYEDI